MGALRLDQRATDHRQPVPGTCRILRPFVFRKYLDFGAFASMRGLHTQIRQEVNRRDMQDNIKLGPGGIREIEFITQVFQLIRGGKETDLQTRSTLVALDLIEQRKLLPAQTVTELRNAYFFLRNLEHRLQYLEDAQTQTLPVNDADRQIIAAAMGYATWPDSCKRSTATAASGAPFRASLRCAAKRAG